MELLHLHKLQLNIQNNRQSEQISQLLLMSNQKANKMTEVKEKVLQVADRCDRCDAQAFVLVKGMSGELYFCGHHYTQHEDALNKFAYEVVDERNYIN